MRILLQIAFFFLGSMAFCQTNQTDDLGRKQGKWVGYYPDTQNIRYEGTFENGIEKGIFTFYDNTQKKVTIATRDFSLGNNKVYTTFYNQKGFKVSEGLQVNKLNEGEWKYYHHNASEIMAIENYKSGKLNGVKKVYYKSGKIAEESYYSNGQKEGIYKKIAENDVVLEEIQYKNDQYHGQAIFRNADGQIEAQGNYKNGIKTGTWQILENGKLITKNIIPRKKPSQQK